MMLGAGALNHALSRIAREAERRHATVPSTQTGCA